MVMAAIGTNSNHFFDLNQKPHPLTWQICVCVRRIKPKLRTSALHDAWIAKTILTGQSRSLIKFQILRRNSFPCLKPFMTGGPDDETSDDVWSGDALMPLWWQAVTDQRCRSIRAT